MNVYNKYYNLKKKLLINNANIWFNKTCLQRNTIPKYAQSQNKPYNNISRQTKKQYSKLRQEMKTNIYFVKKNFQSSQLYNIEMQAYKLYNKFWPIINHKIIKMIIPIG